MKLFSLIKGLNCRVVGNTVVEIKGLYHKDTEVKENGMFFCLRGTRVDGNDFVMSAVRNGAVVVVTEQEIQHLAGVTQIIVRNARESMSYIACKFYGYPSSKLKIIGVTGTNGKTTITHMISSVLESSGKKCAIVGTNGIVIKGKKFDTGMTTPDPIELQKYFSMMVKNKIEYVAMEVSAHALYLHKVDGVTFDCVVFTNLTEDHLDFFKTMTNYFESKAKLFTRKYSNFAVVNGDDFYGEELTKRINIPFVTYAIDRKADIFAEDVKILQKGQSFMLNNQNLIKIPMLGRFNVSNALAAIGVLMNIGLSVSQIQQGFLLMNPVDGRFNFFDINGVLVIVDYAHTPDGLKNVLVACRELAGGKKLYCVFGCGGNREIQKRKIMGEISSSIADFTIITSDNPRFEKRDKIASDIESGMCNDNYLIELDRSKAIKIAVVDMAQTGDVVLVAGKGSEAYIDENGTKIPYSDMHEIQRLRR